MHGSVVYFFLIVVEVCTSDKKVYLPGSNQIVPLCLTMTLSVASRLRPNSSVIVVWPHWQQEALVRLYVMHIRKQGGESHSVRIQVILTDSFINIYAIVPCYAAQNRVVRHSRQSASIDRNLPNRPFLLIYSLPKVEYILHSTSCFLAERFITVEWQKIKKRSLE